MVKNIAAYNLGELETLFERISNIINYIESISLDNNETKLILANGDGINVKIPKNKVAHLLGINTSYLSGLGIFKSESSWSLLKELVSNPYRINKLRSERLISYSELFSDYIEDKVNIFADNMRINLNETDFVCKYDAERSYTTTTKNQKYDYIIVRKNKEGLYYVLCLVKENDYYVPMSSQCFDEIGIDEFLNDHIRNQEITILRQINITNFYKNFSQRIFLPPNELLQKLSQIKSIKTKYNSIIDTTGAFEYHLAQSDKRLIKDNFNSEVVGEMVQSINSNSLIDTSRIFDNNLKTVAEAYNNVIAYNFGDITGVSDTYSNLLEEYNKLREELLQVKQIRDDLEKAMASLVEEKEELEKKNSSYKETEEQILKLLNRKPE